MTRPFNAIVHYNIVELTPARPHPGRDGRHLLSRPGEPALDRFFALGLASAQPSLQFCQRGRHDEYHHRSRTLVQHLPRAFDLDLENDIESLSQMITHGLFRRAVAMPAVRSPLKKETALHPIFELDFTQEEILPAVHLPRSLGSRGSGYGENKSGELPEKAGYQSAFARTRRPGYDYQPGYRRPRLRAGQSTSMSISSLR